MNVSITTGKIKQGSLSILELVGGGGGGGGNCPEVVPDSIAVSFHIMCVQHQGRGGEVLRTVGRYHEKRGGTDHLPHMHHDVSL